MGFWDDLVEDGKELIDNVVDDIQEGWDDFTDNVDDVVDDIQEGWDDFTDNVDDVVDDIQEGWDDFTETVGDYLEDKYYGINTADSTEQILAEHGTRPETNGPVRHVMTFDGTGQEGGSTVHDLHNSIGPVGADGMPQQTAYFGGSGTGGEPAEVSLREGFNQATGADIPARILEGCRYLSANYQAGDEIVMMGYSRGGMEALSLTGMIDTIGLINTEGMTPEEIDAATQEALDLYLNGASEEEIAAFREKYPMHEDPKIDLGLIDPVQTSLDTGHDHDLDASNADSVTVVLSLDENADLLEPMDVSQMPNANVVYFAGDHMTVGGEVPSEAGLIGIPARWLAGELAENTGIGFDPVAFEQNIPQANPSIIVPDGFGNELLGHAGTSTRPIQPGASVHPSVGIRDETVAGYNPPQLQGGAEIQYAENTPPYSPAIEQPDTAVAMSQLRQEFQMAQTGAVQQSTQDVGNDFTYKVQAQMGLG